MSGNGKGKKLGEILIEKGIITERQLTLALDEQKATGDFLGKCLIAHGWASEEQVLRALSEQFSIPFVHLTVKDIQWDIAGQYSFALFNEHLCFPVKQDHTSLTLAICDPLNAWVMSEIESQARGRTVKVVLATPSEIKQMIEEYAKRIIKK